jgi:hypothetical protein
VALACLDQSVEDVAQDVKDRVIRCLCGLIKGKITAKEAIETTKQIMDTDQPAQKAISVLSTGEDPISYRHSQAAALPLSSARRKARNWSPYEDQRLLAGIMKFGLDNWLQVADFVGNGRTRSQVSQRWNRGLNPRIQKGPWTPSEEAELVRQVATHGDKAWKRVATNLGNRSDVQCRYHYGRLEGTCRLPDMIAPKAPDPLATDGVLDTKVNSPENQEQILLALNQIKPEPSAWEPELMFDDFSTNFQLSDSESFWAGQNSKPTPPPPPQIPPVNRLSKKDPEFS